MPAAAQPTRRLTAQSPPRAALLLPQVSEAQRRGLFGRNRANNGGYGGYGYGGYGGYGYPGTAYGYPGYGGYGTGYGGYGLGTYRPGYAGTDYGYSPGMAQS